ncbi:hypothetical protein [Nocardia jejuensis]|uniref:hypothetical protein n=1 Tax=Nocardia jejuensis TaxID=328049 RepID=UPI0012FA7F90|nr:hypothetical protein [Nocardia jejuensis]
MHWVAVGVAVLLLVTAALIGAVAVAKQKRAQRYSTGAVVRTGGFPRRAAPVLAVLGWVVLLAGLAAAVNPVAGDTVAGTAIPAAPGLVQAGVPTSTSTKPAAPDPLSLLKVGDCVEVPMEQATGPSGPTWKAGSPEPSDCATVDANYRVVQTGPEACTDNLYKLESSRHDRAGKLIYHLCMAFDWRVGVCYDTEHMDEPSKVDCGTRGSHIVQATAVLENTTDGNSCPRDGQGAVWVVWDKRHLTVCFRGGDDPGR